ncbi:hypothetical protein RCL_jg3215.t1 [Rhizophagus clarus]|uniref:Uncharacterized protein n=1 Tax=Rhizophagus clarus TaxID=94130 RepID=A0A8H3R1S4_9GLOM|nr:hypothetical protein RCL_jg3215.t1 [Rhizophagus clarus]
MVKNIVLFIHFGGFVSSDKSFGNEAIDRYIQLFIYDLTIDTTNPRYGSGLASAKANLLPMQLLGPLRKGK